MIVGRCKRLDQPSMNLCKVSDPISREDNRVAKHRHELKSVRTVRLSYGAQRA
jgi:hypothetical protein